MNQSDTQGTMLCPSSKCKDGAQLLGIVKEDGHVDMLKEAIPIDQNFVDIANSGRLPEMRFRFADKCIKTGCKQWTGERCGVIDNVIHQIENLVQVSPLPECSIRMDCRWFDQSGADACKVCPYVITEVTEMML